MKKIKTSIQNQQPPAFNFQTHVSLNIPSLGKRTGSAKPTGPEAKNEKTLARSLSVKQRRSLPALLSIEKSVINVSEQKAKNNGNNVPIYDNKGKATRQSRQEAKVTKSLATGAVDLLPERQKAFKIKKIQQKSKRVQRDTMAKGPDKGATQKALQDLPKGEPTKVAKEEDVKIGISLEDRPDAGDQYMTEGQVVNIQSGNLSQRDFEGKDKRIRHLQYEKDSKGETKVALSRERATQELKGESLKQGAKRRGSHEGTLSSLPLAQEAFRQTKISQVDTQNKRINRVLENFESSQNSQRQEMIGEMFDKINNQESGTSDSKERQAPAVTSINLQQNRLGSETSAKIQRFLELIAAQEYEQAEQCLQKFWVESDSRLNQKDPASLPKKQVKFNMQAQPEGTNTGSAKPPLNQSRSGQLRVNKSKMLRSHGQFKPAESPEEFEKGTEKGNTQQTFQLPAGAETAQSSGGNQFGILSDLLKMAQKSDGKQNPTSNRKLLAYLQQQMLFEQKVQSQPAKGDHVKEEKHKIEKEIESDLNYLNVFVAPIGSINIFAQEQEAKAEGPAQGEAADFDAQLRQLILASPLRPILDERVLSCVSDSLKPSEKAHGGALQLQTVALEEVLGCVLPRQKDCSEQDQAMKQDILNQILPFVESLRAFSPGFPDHTRVVGSSQEQEDPYLQGLDVVASMTTAGSEEGPEDLFDLSRIQEFRKSLNAITDQHQLTDDKTAEAMTFLTEQFPNAPGFDEYNEDEEDGDEQKLPRSRFETRSRVKGVISSAKQFSEDERKKNALETQFVVSKYQKRKLQIEELLQRLETEQNAMKDVGSDCVLSKSLRSKLLYLCFVECTRLIGKHSKSHALLALKTWHQYFNLAQTEVRRVGSVLHQQVLSITRHIKSLVSTVQNELGKQRVRDMEVLKLKHDYIKTLDLLGILTRNLYREESRATVYKLKLNTLQDNLKLVYPNCMEYLMQKSQEELGDQKEVEETALALPGSGEPRLLDQVSKEVNRKMLERRAAVERQNRQVASFQSQIIYKCGVTSTQEDSTPNESEEDAEGPDGQPAEAQKAGYLGALRNNLTREVERQLASRRKESGSIYDHLVVDIERILAVIPAKIRVQEKLEAANKTIAHQKVRLQTFERLQAKAEKDIRVLQERCTELTTEMVQQEGRFNVQLLILRKENEARIEEVRRLEQEKAKTASKKATHDEEVMTTVGADDEQILRQREFNQALVKFRGVNKAPRRGHLKLSKAAEEALIQGTPPLENIYVPIGDIMQRVKRGGSKFMAEKELKSVKNVLKMIAGLLQAKIAAMDKSANDVQALMNIDCFFYHHVQQTYGLQALADRYCEVYLASVEAHRKKDTRIELFRKFVGLDLDRLPYSIFERYVALVKATGVPVASLFLQNMQSMFVDYSKVRHTFKDLLQDASLHIQRETYKQLKKHTKVVTDNLALLRVLDLEDYEVFKDLQEQTIRSRYKSTAAVLQALFMEAGGDEEEGLVSDDEDEDARKRVFVTKGHLADFLMRSFDLNDYSRGALNLGPGKTVKRVYGMIDSFFIAGQGLDPQRLALRDLTTGFREKVELRVPAAAYFHVAINARVEHENDENAGYAKIYQFYSQLEVEVEELSGEMTAKDVKTAINLEGMDFQQFVAFLKDAASPLVAETKRQAAYEIYRATCEPRQRDRLTCEDFIEAIRKYRLVPPVEVIGAAMRRRECEVARNIRADLLSQGFAVPDVIAEAAVADPEAAVPDEEADPELARLTGGNMEPPGQGQGTRLRDLLALSGTAPLVPEATEVAEKEEEVKDPAPQKQPNLDVSSGSDASGSPLPAVEVPSSGVATSADVTKQSSAGGVKIAPAVVSSTADGEQANIIIAGTTPKQETKSEAQPQPGISTGGIALLQFAEQGVMQKVEQMRLEQEELARTEEARKAAIRGKKEKGSDESSSEEPSAEERAGPSDSEGGSEDD